MVNSPRNFPVSSVNPKPQKAISHPQDQAYNNGMAVATWLEHNWSTPPVGRSSTLVSWARNAVKFCNKATYPNHKLVKFGSLEVVQKFVVKTSLLCTLESHSTSKPPVKELRGDGPIISYGLWKKLGLGSSGFAGWCFSRIAWLRMWCVESLDHRRR